MRKIFALTGLLAFLAISIAGAAPEIDPEFNEQKNVYLSRINSELNFWDEIVQRELSAQDPQTQSSDRDKLLQDLALQIKDLRGDRLKLLPSSEDVWRDLQPAMERNLSQLRQGFRDIR